MNETCFDSDSVASRSIAGRERQSIMRISGILGWEGCYLGVGSIPESVLGPCLLIFGGPYGTMN